MQRLVLTYGGLSGLIIVIINTVSMELGFGHVWLGIAVMFIAFSMIYVAIKQHRDQNLSGLISFKAGMLVGLGVSIVASLVYVLIWECYLMLTNYAFIDSYANTLLEASGVSSASDEEIARASAAADSFREQYQNPLIRIPMSFLEIFPVALVITLISALLLRNSKVTT